MVYGILIALALVAQDPSTAGAVLRIEPAAPVLHGADARQQLLVTDARDGSEFDATDDVVFRSAQPSIASVSADGVVRPVADGVAQITATLGDRSGSIDVKVENAGQLPSLHFGRDIIPLLTKA